MKRDIRISVSRGNRDIFAMCVILKKKGYSPSHFICTATREKFERDVKVKVQSQVLSSRQQTVAVKRQVIVRPHRQKTEIELRQEEERKSEELRLKEEKERDKQAELERCRRIMKS